MSTALWLRAATDYPNQVNNVLGFPYIFRGALDVRATEINEEMKLAAVKALAELAKKPVPDIVNMAYGNANLKFGRDYIIPKPVDPRPHHHCCTSSGTGGHGIGRSSKTHFRLGKIRNGVGHAL